MTKSSAHSPRLTQSDIYLAPAQSYTCQKTRGFVARKDNTPWPLSLPLDWGADPFNDPNWCSKLQHWRMTDPILKEYFDTGEGALLAEAFLFVVDWHRFHVKEGRTAPKSWSDAVTGIRLARLAFFLDRFQCGELALTDEDEHVLRTLIALHVENLMHDDFISTSNHGLFQVLGLKLASLVLEDERNAEILSQYADKKFEEIFSAQYDEYGVHREHSPSYHFFAEKIISPIEFHFNSEHVRLILEKVEQVKRWLLFPDGLTVRVGDSNGRRRDFEPPSGPTETLDDGRAFLVGNLTTSGYAIVRSPEKNGQSMLFSTAMANSTTHKHADELSFELFEHGRPILIDSGKYGYFSDQARKYVKSAAAHNTVALQDKPIVPSKTLPVDSSFRPVSNDGAHFRGQGLVIRAGLFKHERTFLYNPARYLIILDKVKSSGRLFDLLPGSRHQFVSSLHFAPDLALDFDACSIIAQLPDGQRLYVDELTGAKLEMVRGRHRPMLGWHSERYGEITPTTTLRSLKAGSALSFAWVICVDESYRNAALRIGKAELARLRL